MLKLLLIAVLIGFAALFLPIGELAAAQPRVRRRGPQRRRRHWCRVRRSREEGYAGWTAPEATIGPVGATSPVAGASLMATAPVLSGTVTATHVRSPLPRTPSDTGAAPSTDQSW